MSNDLVSRQQAGTTSGTRSASEEAMPGKRTLVGLAHSAAVQMHGGGAQSESAVHAAASRGVATPAAPLPFGDTIQRAFGRHDISSVQAHTGPEAARSASAMGADAYATGDHVVLGKTDLHTVAHETAHVVQQRSGVQLKGGVGQAGDAYERHADAVADKVVAGESAEPLLSEMVGPGGAGGAVQQRARALPVQQTKGKAQPLDGEREEQSEHDGEEEQEADEEHEAGEHEASADLQDSEPAPEGMNAAEGSEHEAAGSDGEAAQSEAPLQMKASSARALGAI